MNNKRILAVLLSAAVLFSVLPGSVSAATAVSVGDSFTYTPEEHWGVTNDIWSWQWALADTESFSNMKFTNVSGQGDCYVADWKKYPYCAARKDGINVHPNEDADAARVFTAPASGWVTIDATIARAQQYDSFGSNSPTSFRILLEGTTIYPTVGEHRILTSTTEETITCQVFIKAGEKLRFVVGAIDDRTSDAVNLQTTVRYDSVTTDAGEICRVGETFTHVKTDQTWGQSDPHWSWEWTPAGQTSFAAMTYQYVDRYSKYMYASDWSVNPYNYVDQLGVKIHPAAEADTVKTFTVPYSGTVKLATEVSRFTNLAEVSTSGANGTSLRILVNETQVYPLYSDVLVLDSTSAKTFAVSLPVTAGDKIRIVIGSMGQTSSDALKMDNTVTYTSVEAPAVCVADGETFSVSSTQWANNTMGNWSFEWRDADDTFGDMTYQYVSSQGKYLYTSGQADQYADLLGVKLQPGQSRDVVKTYEVPCNGRIEMKVRVARYSQYVTGGTTTPTTLCIYKNNEQIWPADGSQMQITATSQTTYSVSADVWAGDKIRCVVGSMGDGTDDAVEMYNTVTYRAVGTRELAAAADQYNQRIDVINVWGDNLDSAETAWSWKPTTALGFSSIDTFNSPTDAKIRYSQALKKYVVAVSASRGFMGVVDFATGEKIWQVSVTDESNPHSIEYLPNGNVVVAASKKHWIRVYTASQGKDSKNYAEATVEGAHGVLWDPERELLWVLGYSVITAYRIGGTAAAPTLTELTEYRATLPNVSAGGHDLSAVYGDNNKLWISSESVYLYDVNEKTFSQDYSYAEVIARRSVKGVSSFPDTGTMVHVYPNNTYLEHDSDRFYVTLLQDGKFYGVTHSHSTGAYYKVRSWIPTYQTQPRSNGGILPGTHFHSYQSQVVAPTCTSAGYTVYTCITCGDRYSDNYVAMVGHSYSNSTVTKDPTCTEAGYTGYSCTVCGGIYTISEVPATGHQYIGTVTKDPTCNEMGVVSYRCTICGMTYTETVPAMDHAYETQVVSPTCSAEGYTVKTCTICGQTSIIDRIPTTGHSYAVITTKTPSCAEPGNMLYICSCGASYNETIPALGHTYQSQTVPPTCSTDGYTTYTCSLCADSYNDNVISATGHSYVYGNCSVCGAEDSEYVPTYYLVGYINGADYGFEADYMNMGAYRFVNGRLTVTFTQNSYVFLKTEGNANWYMTHSYCTDTTATFYNTKEGTSEKMFIPGGVEITFTLIKNSDGSLTLSYATGNQAVVVPTLTLKVPSLEFKDMICITAFYTAEDIQDVVEMGMITYSSKVDRWSVDTAEYVIPGATYVESSGRYYSGSQGIHAKYLGDTMYLAVYAKLSDGSYAYSKLAGYSAVQYATNQLKNSSDTKLKQLVAAMLNYGAQAQLYFGHNTQELANSTMSPEQKALPSSYHSGMIASVPTVFAEKQGNFVNNQGFSSRKPAVSFEGAFCINYFFTPKYVPDSGITMYYWNEVDYEATSVLTPSNATGKIKLEGTGTGQYSGDITGISAKALSEAVYVACAYKSGGTVWTSGVLGYSIGAYCASQSTKGGAIADLAMATAVYGYHAKQYFG